MRSLLTIAFALAAGMALAALAAAQDQPAEAGGGQRMSKFDRDQDGVISKDEWPARPETFDKIDSNGDGKLDTVEMAAAREKAREFFQERGKAGKGQADWNKARERARGAAMFAAALFHVVDSDNDRKMSMAELDAFTDRVKKADLDQDGFVTAQEVRRHMRTEMSKRIGEKLVQRFDADKDGKIAREEFKGDDERFKKLDFDGDGFITVDDFTARASKAPEEPREGRGEAGPMSRGGTGRRETWRQGMGSGTETRGTRGGI